MTGAATRIPSGAQQRSSKTHPQVSILVPIITHFHIVPRANTHVSPDNYVSQDNVYPRLEMLTRTGADLGRTGGFSWHDSVPTHLTSSWARAKAYGQYDDQGGGHYFWDAEEDRFWTWETVGGIRRKFTGVMEVKGLGGAFAWGLGEDAVGWVHFTALTGEMRRYNKDKIQDHGELR